MLKSILISSVLLTGCAVTSPDRNTKWIFDVPQEDIQFIFIPSGIDNLMYGLPSKPTEIEATYKIETANKSNFIYLEPSTNYATTSGSKGSEASEVKLKTTIPPSVIISEVIVDYFGPVPEEYIGKRDWKIDRNGFSKYLSTEVSKKYSELNDLAKIKNGNAVIISQQNTYLDETANNQRYGIYIKASIVKLSGE